MRKSRKEPRDKRQEPEAQRTREAEPRKTQEQRPGQPEMTRAVTHPRSQPVSSARTKNQKQHPGKQSTAERIKSVLFVVARRTGVWGTFPDDAREGAMTRSLVYPRTAELALVSVDDLEVLGREP